MDTIGHKYYFISKENRSWGQQGIFKIYNTNNTHILCSATVSPAKGNIINAFFLPADKPHTSRLH